MCDATDDGCRQSLKDGFVKIALTVEWLTGAVTVVCHSLQSANSIAAMYERNDSKLDRGVSLSFGYRSFCDDRNYCDSALPRLAATPQMQASIDVSHRKQKARINNRP